MDANNESKDPKPNIDEITVNADKKSTETEEKLYKDELEKVVSSAYETLSQINPLQDYKNMTEQIQDSINEKLADVKAKVEGVISRLNPVEHGKKLKDLLENLSKQNFTENIPAAADKLSSNIKDSTAQVATLYKQNLANAKANIDSFFSLLQPQDLKN